MVTINLRSNAGSLPIIWQRNDPTVIALPVRIGGRHFFQLALGLFLNIRVLAVSSDLFDL